MSYDLYFTKPHISQDDFARYFAGRPHYELSPGQAIYENKDTGVYFMFDYNEPKAGDGESSGSVSFNMNYLRPHYFALEAVSEVSSFITHFNCSILDPQNDGMGEGPYSPEGFVRGWNAGNRFGYSAILNDKRHQEVYTYPTQQLEAIWQWNYQKAATQEGFGESIFVPRIFFVLLEGRAVSTAVWPDAIGELVPQVDCLFIGRDQFAPKPLFGARKKDTCLVRFSEVAQFLMPYHTAKYPLPAYLLPTTGGPEPVKQFIRNLWPADPSAAKGIPGDQVLNRELVETALSSRR